VPLKHTHSALIAISALFVPVMALTQRAIWGTRHEQVLLLAFVNAFLWSWFLRAFLCTKAHRVPFLLIGLMLMWCYPVRMVVLAGTIESWSAESMTRLSYIRRWVPHLTAESLYSAYKSAIVGHSVYILTSLLLVQHRDAISHAWARDVDGVRARQMLPYVLLVVTLLAAGVMLVGLKLGVQRMGTTPQRLPFRLGGVLVFVRDLLLRYILPFLLYFCVARRLRLHCALVGISATMLAFLESYCTASRAAPLLALTQYSFLLLSIGKLRLERVRLGQGILLGLGFLVITALFPYFTQYRYVRNAGIANDWQAFREAAAYVSAEIRHGPVVYLVGALDQFGMRLLGAEHLVVVQTLRASVPIDVLLDLTLRDASLGRLYTQEILGINTASYELIHGLMGGFWLVGRDLGIVVGMVGLVMYVRIMTDIHAFRYRFVSAPALLSAYLMATLHLVSDGNITRALSPERLLLTAVAIFLTEAFARSLTRFTISNTRTVYAIADHCR